jgi:hypothetical protein
MATSGRIAFLTVIPASILAFVGASARAGQSPPASGPTEIRARGVEFRRFDPRTGKVVMVVSAANASAAGEAATLDEVKFVRYSPAGTSVLEASASSGRILSGGSVSFDGEVAVAWRGAKAVATFRSGAAVWNGETGVLTSNTPVCGTFRGATGTKLEAGKPSKAAQPPKGKPPPKPEPAKAFRLDVEGTGLVVEPGGDRGRILRDVSAVATGGVLGAWRVTADGGMGFSGFAGNSPVLTASGPVGLEAHGMTVRADSAEITLREGGKGGKGSGGQDADGGLAISRAWLTGTVRARVEGGRAFPWGEGPVEVRAEAAELAPGGAGGADARVLLMGTESDPARVFLPRGVLRGTRIEITPGGVRTEGGARSEFRFGGGR